MPTVTIPAAKRRLGALASVAVVPPDFDAPLPETVVDAFEGGGSFSPAETPPDGTMTAPRRPRSPGR
jgi:hypothetical protein